MKSSIAIAILRSKQY